jgi:hypothetical protein
MSKLKAMLKVFVFVLINLLIGRFLQPFGITNGNVLLSCLKNHRMGFGGFGVKRSVELLKKPSDGVW